MSRGVARTLIALVLSLIAVLGILLPWVIGGELSAPVPRSIGSAPSSLSGAEDVAFHSASGSLIHGWFVSGTTGQGAVLLLHGVRGDRRDMLARAVFLHDLGYTVLLIDFQAHGESPGERITFGDLESRDVVAALTYLQHRASPGERLGVIGVSLGAAAFILAEGRPPVNAVILESMYPTIEQAVTDRLRLHLGPAGPVLAPLLMLQIPYRLGTSLQRLRPIDRMGSVGAPVLILSGTRDQHTTLEEAYTLFAAAHAPKSFWAVAGAAHVNLHTYAKAEYERRVAAFLGAELHSTVLSPVSAEKSRPELGRRVRQGPRGLPIAYVAAAL